MKNLYLVRHAKSSWQHEDLSDLDRPLNRRGQHDAPIMGQRLCERGVRPDLILCSPALRALRTAWAIAGEIAYPTSRIGLEERIYTEDSLGLLQLIMATNDDIHSLMLVGHNPDMTLLCNHLSSPPIDNIPTCGVAAFQCDIQTWQALSPKKIKRIDFDYPKRVQ